MKPRAYILRFFIVVTTALSAFACVTVGLPGKEVVPADDTKYESPTTPFQEVEISGIQKAWRSQSTSNVISVITNCSESSDPSIEVLEADAKSAFDDYTVIETKELLFNDRRASRSLVKGKLDGISARMDLLVFKKDGCRFTLSYSGRSESFPSERSYFETFINSYKAP